jgi:arylsulfatase A-like enzyme
MAYSGNGPGVSTATRSFTTSSGVVWLSALISIDETWDRAILWIDSVGGSSGDDFVGVLDGNIQMRYNNTNLTTAGAPTIGTHLLLAKAELNVSGSNDRLSFWFDPNLSGGEAGLGTPTYSNASADTFGTAIDGIGVLLVDRNFNGSVYSTDADNQLENGELIDAIRVGTTFADVTDPEDPPPPPPPINASDGYPNVLILLADDIGYEALGAYGGLDFNTPNLDTMAAQGVRFSHAYTSPACTPSRVSMHTSRYTTEHGETYTLPVHLGVDGAVDFQSMPTFAQLVQARGYQTSTTGKWQLATLHYHPNHIAEAGFDSWCVWQIWDGTAKTERYWNPYFNRDGAVLNNISTRYGPDVLEEYVWERMTTARDADEPFLIVHNMLLPHDPITDTPRDRELVRPASLGNMIEYLDHLVGLTLAKIDDLGIRNNTYVFFIGDNGTEANEFPVRHTTAGNVTGGKRDLTDAGTHVPLLVWGPPGLKPGSVVSDLIDITDIFPTVCQLTKTTIPETIPYRGTSFVPQIHGRRGIPRKTVHFGFQTGFGVFDGSWRLRNDNSLLNSGNLPSEPVATPGPATDEARARLAPLLDGTPDPVPGATSLLETWRGRNFGDATANPTLEAGVWGDDANPDHDFLSNRLEYLLGFDPNLADTAPDLFSLTLDGGAPSFHALIRTDDPSGTVAPQVSTNLSDWPAADSLFEIGEAAAINPGFTEVYYRWPDGGPPPPAMFFRYQAQQE